MIRHLFSDIHSDCAGHCSILHGKPLRRDRQEASINRRLYHLHRWLYRCSIQEQLCYSTCHAMHPERRQQRNNCNVTSDSLRYRHLCTKWKLYIIRTNGMDGWPCHWSGRYLIPVALPDPTKAKVIRKGHWRTPEPILGLEIDLLVPDHLCVDYLHLSVVLYAGNHSHHRWQRVCLKHSMEPAIHHLRLARPQTGEWQCRRYE